MTTKEEKKIKRILRRARLHIKVVNARERKVPTKLAEIGALVAAVCAGINAHGYGGLVAGAAIVMFLICSIMFQALSHIVFGIIGLITARAYNRQQGSHGRRYYADWDHLWDDEDEWRSYRHEGTSQNRSGYEDSRGYSDNSQYRQKNTYEDSAQPGGGMSVERAMRMFGMQAGMFTSSDLKERWHEMIKKNHPDQNVNSGSSGKYEERTKQINAAYEVLKSYACDAGH